MRINEKRKGGRNPKLDPATHRYCVRFTGAENQRLMEMFRKSGMSHLACFIKAQFFGQEFHTFTESPELKPYINKLTDLHSQFRTLGNEYNLALKEMKFRYSENRTAQLIQRMEKSLQQMAKVMEEAVRLTEHVRERQQ